MAEFVEPRKEQMGVAPAGLVGQGIVHLAQEVIHRRLQRHGMPIEVIVALVKKRMQSRRVIDDVEVRETFFEEVLELPRRSRLPIRDLVLRPTILRQQSRIEFQFAKHFEHFKVFGGFGVDKFDVVVLVVVDDSLHLLQALEEQLVLFDPFVGRVAAGQTSERVPVDGEIEELDVQEDAEALGDGIEPLDAIPPKLSQELALLNLLLEIFTRNLNEAIQIVPCDSIHVPHIVNLSDISNALHWMGRTTYKP